MQQEEDNKKNLEKSREKNNQIKNVHNPVPLNASKKIGGLIKEFSGLSRYIDPIMDSVFGLVLCLSITKDLLDIIMQGPLWIISVLLTIFISFLVFFSTLIVRANNSHGGTVISFFLKKMLVLVASSFPEFIPGNNFFPYQTAGVIITYILILKERRLSKDKP